MSKEINNLLSKAKDMFGLRHIDFNKRNPEQSEIFSNEEAKNYIDGCDYPESVDDQLFAWEIKERFNHIGIEHMHILDAMTGPGRLGRELLDLGAQHVTFHDGHDLMLNHAQKKASELFSTNRFSSILSPVNALTAHDNTFDLIVCHNSPHQLNSEDKLQRTIAEFVRVLKPGGWIVIADYQRSNSPEFIETLENRLRWTKTEIVPLLKPTFQAAFSKEEFDDAIQTILGVQQWFVCDATLPTLTAEMKSRIDQDPVKGHVLDFSPISCRVFIQKEEI